MKITIIYMIYTLQECNHTCVSACRYVYNFRVVNLFFFVVKFRLIIFINSRFFELLTFGSES